MKRIERNKSETVCSKIKDKSSTSLQDNSRIKNDKDNIKIIKENSNESNHQDFCPVDKKQIEKIINDLSICKLTKKKSKVQHVDSKNSNESITNNYELLCSKLEDEKCKLKSKLLETTGQLQNLRIQTSNYLDDLSQQVKSQEKEYLKLADIVNDLIRDKIQLENSLKIMNNQIKRSKEFTDVKELLFQNNQQLKLIDNIKIDQACQTDSSTI